MTTKITLNNIADTALATLTGPKVTTIVYPGTETATDVVGGATINLTGGGFQSGCSVLVASTASSVVTFINSTQISFIAPALSAGTYVIYVINPDGGTAISIPGVSYSGTPNWTTTAGSLGNAYETGAISATLTATGDAPLTYTLASGTLPTGSTLASNGTLSGTAQATASATTYSFTVTARDAQNQTTNRSFSLTINPDVVTWSTPTASATYNVDKDSAISNVTLSATSAAGGSITYTADTLPTGLSITGANIAGTPTVAASTTTTLTATSTATRTATRTINWVVSVAGDTYFPYTTLLLSGNGSNNATNATFIDSSTNNFTITRNGNTTQGTFSPYGGNWSNYFDGTSDFLTAPAGSGSLSTSNFTVEGWIFCTANPVAFSTIFSNYSTPGTTAFAIFSSFQTNNRITLYVGGSTAVVGSTIVYNSWTHIAAVRNSGVTTLYINGVSQGTVSYSGSSSGDGIARIGCAGDASTTTNFQGYISNSRWIIGTAIYTSNFTPSTSPLTAITNTSLLTCQSNRFIDNSTNNFTITKFGDTNIQRFSPFSPTQAYSTSTIGGSGYFNGSTDYITIPYTGDPTTNFTIEFWWYPTTLAPNYQEIFTKGIGIQVFTSGSTMTAAFAVNGGSYYLNAGFGTATVNSWNHIAVVKNSTTYTGYVNGVGTVIGTSSSVPGTQSNPVTIGYYAPSAQYWTNGYISDARYVTNSAVYTANFTPPTAPLTAIANTVLLTNFTNAGVIDNTMLNNLETVGNAQISTAQTKFGSGSMYFDGTEDHLSTYNPSYSLSVGSGDFTFECWLYLNSLPSFAAAVYHLKNDAGLATTVFDLEITPAGAISVSTGTALIATGTSGKVTTGSWIHFAFVRTSGVFKTFFNGTQDISISNSTTYNGTYLQIGAFRYSSYYSSLNGYIDDLRITKGYARYTANFTPTTTAFSTK